MAVAFDKDNEVRAEAKWVRMSARKARVVADHIRGRSVPEARTVLAFTPRAAAREIEKVLKSAVANAEANHGLIGDELVIVAAYADEGPTMKRGKPRARGRFNRIFKRTCHITLELVPGEAPAQRRPTRAAKPETTEETPAETEAKPKAKASRRKKAEEKTEEAVA